MFTTSIPGASKQYSSGVQSVSKEYPSGVQGVPRLVIQDVHKEYPSSTHVMHKECASSSSSVTRSAQAVAQVYQENPSSSSSVPGVPKQ